MQRIGPPSSYTVRELKSNAVTVATFYYHCLVQSFEQLCSAAKKLHC